MAGTTGEFRTVVFTHRLRGQAVVDTMSEQVPEVRDAFHEIEEQMLDQLGSLLAEGWGLISHAHNIYNSILIVSVILVR